MIRHALLVALALAVTPAPTAAQPPTDLGLTASVDQWTLQCSNLRVCLASGHQSRSLQTGSILHVQRAPAADAVPILSIAVGGYALPPTEVVVAIDGVEVARLDGNVPQGEPIPIDGTGASSRILDAIRSGRTITIHEGDASGRRIGEIPATGATDILRLMDRHQRREDTVTALVEVGPAPASAIPAPPVAPVAPARRRAPFVDLTDAERTALARAITLSERCGERQRAEPPRVLSLHRLTPARRLVEVECWTAAYNTGSIFYVMAPDGALAEAELAPTRLSRLEDGRLAPDERHAILSNPEFDAETSTLIHFHKGRGLGDCWDAASWRFDGERFTAVSATQVLPCRDDVEPDPIVLFTSRDE